MIIVTCCLIFNILPLFIPQLVFFLLLYSVSKSGNIESFPYSLPTDHPIHPNAVQSRVTLAGNDGMTQNAQSRSQFRCPEERVQPKKESSETSRSPASKVSILINGRFPF